MFDILSKSPKHLQTCWNTLYLGYGRLVTSDPRSLKYIPWTPTYVYLRAENSHSANMYMQMPNKTEIESSKCMYMLGCQTFECPRRLQEAPKCSRRSQNSPESTRRLQKVPQSSTKLHKATEGFKMLQKAPEGFRRLKKAPKCFRMLQKAPEGSKMLLNAPKFFTLPFNMLPSSPNISQSAFECFGGPFPTGYMIQKH